MPIPLIIWGGFAIAGIGATGWTASQLSDAADSGARLTKWVVIGGTVYASFRALQAAGAIK